MSLNDETMILRAEHDGMLNGTRCREDDGTIEMIVSGGAGGDETVKIGVAVLVEAYQRIWGQKPERIYRTIGTALPPMDETERTLVWPEPAQAASDALARLADAEAEIARLNQYVAQLEDYMPKKKWRKLLRKEPDPWRDDA